jgi:hypothetical protein
MSCNFFKIERLLATAIILSHSGCGPGFSAPEKCGFLQNENLSRLSWKSSVPVVFSFSDDIPDEARASITRAFESWNEAKRKTLFRISDSESEETALGTIEASGTLQSLGAAHTQLKKVGDRITGAKIVINSELLKTSTGSNLLVPDLETVMVHEAGHALGLDHNSSKQSVMRPRLESGEYRKNPSDEDLKNLECEY